jgi:hypothetical protein
MSNDAIRKEFETWLSDTHGQHMVSAWCERTQDYNYLACTIAFEAWKASRNSQYTAVDVATAAADGFRDGRASVVVVLPPSYPVLEEPDEAMDDSYMDAYHAANGMRHACKQAIIATGGRVKE